MITVGRQKEVEQCDNDRKEECAHIASVYWDVHGKNIKLCSLCARDFVKASVFMVSSILGISAAKMIK